MLERKGMSAEEVFEKYDKNKNFLLGADEIQIIISDILNIDMFPIET